jgi:hypothetical protein
MLKLKKIWLFLLGIMVVFGFNLQFTHWLKDWYPRDHQHNQWSQWQLRYSTPTVDEEEISETDPIWSGSLVMWNKTKWILHLPQASEYKTELWYALSLIKIAVNWILGMLAFVAVIYVLYCWSLILSSGSDDKSAEKWKKWIKTASIAIAWIALAWLIISAMIWFIQILLPESD